MRHRKKSEKFSRPRAQRKALIRSLLRAIITCERIITTESKAKGVRRFLDRLINLTKENTVHHRRLAYRWLNDHSLVKRLFENIGPRFKHIKGGFTRIINLGYRKGDRAKLSILELTKIEKKEKKVKEKKVKEKVEVQKEEKEKIIPQKETPKKGIISGVKRIFKKERDSL